MKRIFLFLLVSLILILSAVQTEAKTLYRSVTAPALYWQFYNGYYAPMATRAYYSIPPMFRPVRVYQQRGVIPPQPVYTPSQSGNTTPQHGTVSPSKRSLTWQQQSVLRRQKLVAQRKKAAEQRKKESLQRKKLNLQRRAKSHIENH